MEVPIGVDGEDLAELVTEEVAQGRGKVLSSGYAFIIYNAYTDEIEVVRCASTRDMAVEVGKQVYRDRYKSFIREAQEREDSSWEEGARELLEKFNETVKTEDDLLEWEDDEYERRYIVRLF